MPDNQFERPRLAELYDFFDDDRSDLDHYEQIVLDFDATSVLDIGSGTGLLGARLATQGLTVHGIEPALAMHNVASRNHQMSGLTWHHGYAHDLPAAPCFDIALMTGNVAQVFVEDDDWAQTLEAVRARLNPDGVFVFETRDPAQRAWTGWTRELRTTVRTHPTYGRIEHWVDLTEEALPLVTFSAGYRFLDQDVELHSSSTLRFRTRDELDDSLVTAGFEVLEVRDAPDRPNLEWVYIARVLPT